MIIEENGVLYPVEIKMSGNPKAGMGAANQVLDKIHDKQRGTGIILCLVDKKTYLRENLIASTNSRKSAKMTSKTHAKVQK